MLELGSVQCRIYRGSFVVALGPNNTTVEPEQTVVEMTYASC